MDDLGEPTWGMRVTLALLILLFISPSSEDSGRCVPRSCRDFDEECWSNAESLSSQGEALADQGRFSDAMQCFTYAANSLQDERLLSRPSALPYERRRVLFRLYSSASLAILRARRGGGAVGDDWLKTWLRRAVQIVSPSAQILFDENDLDEEQEAASKTPPDRADVESCQRKECEEHAREKDWDSAFFCQQDFLLCSSLRLPASKSAMASLAWQIFRLGAFGHLHGNFSIALRSFHLVERLISDLEAFELGQEPEEMKTLKLNNLVSMAKAYEKSEKYAASLKAYGRALRDPSLPPFDFSFLVHACCLEAYRIRDQVGDVFAAISLLQRVLRWLPATEREGRAKLLLDLCASFRLVQQGQQGLKHCEMARSELLEQKEKHQELLSKTHFNMGIIFYDNMSWAQSCLHLHVSDNLQSDRADTNMFLAMTWMKLALEEHDFERMQSFLQEQEPQRISFLDGGVTMCDLSRVGRRVRRTSSSAVYLQALCHLLRVFSFNPKDSNIYMLIGQIMLRTGNYEELPLALAPIAQAKDKSKFAIAPYSDNILIDEERPKRMMERLLERLEDGTIDLSPSYGGAAGRKWTGEGRERKGRGEQQKEAGAMRACSVVYLTSNSTEDLTDLYHSLLLLQSNFFDIHGFYPVIVFHDGLSSDNMRWIKETPGLVLDLSFELVDLREQEEHLKDPAAAVRGQGMNFFSEAPTQGLGYRNMCRFFSGPIFHTKALGSMEYYMRLDTDSFLLAPLPRDPFLAMNETGGAYGFLARAVEHPSLSAGLYEAVRGVAGRLDKTGQAPSSEELLVHRGLLGSQLGRWDGSFFYNNLEVLHLPFWRSPAQLEIFDALDRLGGFLRSRWGDGPVRTLSLAFTGTKRELVRFDDVPYWHQNLVLL